MPKILDDVSYISRQIGPRPAGTEEEQRAALYIANELKRRSELPVRIEEFECEVNAGLARNICVGITALSIILYLVFPVLLIPAVCATTVSFVLYAAEFLHKPLLSRLTPRGVSQNIIATYVPKNHPSKRKRRRKVVVVSHYDSGRVTPISRKRYIALTPHMNKLCLLALFVIPVVYAIKMIFLSADQAQLLISVISYAALLVLAYPLITSFFSKHSSYNEGANYNASGTAVLMDLVKKVDEACEEHIPEQDHVYASQEEIDGLLPGGVELVDARPDVTDEDQKQLDGLALAKEAISKLPGAKASVSTAAVAASVVGEGAQELQNAGDEEVEPAVSVVTDMSSLPDWYIKAQENAHKSDAREPEISPSQRSRFADALNKAESESAGLIEHELEKLKEKEIIEQLRAFEQKAAEEKAQAMAEAQSIESEISDESRDSQVSEAEHQENAELVQEHSTSNEMLESDAQASSQEATIAPHVTLEDVQPTVEQIDDVEPNATQAPQEQRTVIYDFAEVVQDAYEATDATIEHSDAIEQAEETPQDDFFSLEDALYEEEVPSSELEDAPVNPVSRKVEATSLIERIKASSFAQAFKKPFSSKGNSGDNLGDEQDDVVSLDELVVEADQAVVDLGETQAFDLSLLETSEDDALADVSKQDEPSSESSALLESPLTSEHEDDPTSQDDQSQEVVPETSGDLETGSQDDKKAPQSELPIVVDIPSPKPERAFTVSLPEIEATQDPAQSVQQVLHQPVIPEIPEINPEGEQTIQTKQRSLETLPSMSGTISSEPIQTHTIVSQLGSFTASDATGAFKPVGDELVADRDPEDIYVDDADDSVYEENMTDLGVHTGAGYVDVPESRMGKLFGRFGKKKTSQSLEESPQEWLDLDEDFEARKVGRERGSWESFRQDDKEWEGGAVTADASYDESEQEALARKQAELSEVYSFYNPDIDTEVWFVALGAELSNNAGMEAFLTKYEQELKGALVINLEGVGAGELSLVEEEGLDKKFYAPGHMKRYLRKASQATGFKTSKTKTNWRDSAATAAQRHRLPAASLVGTKDGTLAHWGELADVVENIKEDQLQDVSNYLYQLIKMI